MEKEKLNFSLIAGAYIGEISALCFLHLHPTTSKQLYLLAGSGSQLLLYHLSIHVPILVKSFQVFRGIRVHGISCVQYASFLLSSSSSFTELRFFLAVFGEKRVKLFCLKFTFDDGRRKCIDITMELINSLPNLNHWVLDVIILQGGEGRQLVVIGSSDNSVYVWDVLHRSYMLVVQHPERCLLYSMRLWGDKLDELWIASGTIFNTINLWKLTSSEKRTLTDHLENDATLSHETNEIFNNHRYVAVHICKLVGHEGSIFRIAWSTDGRKLVSASDDRSARIWFVDDEKKCYGDLELTAKVVLFGHNARVWDCYLSNSLIITAGEDCTCRLWDLDGKQLAATKEHTGRGVWRCLYDADTSFLISAGFDSAIKVHRLSILPGILKKESGIIDGTKTITFQIPNLRNNAKLMDSKSEYVRCLHLTSEDTLYISTNTGYLYCAKILANDDIEWTQLVHVGNGPIICMDVMSVKDSSQSDLTDWVACGDGKGRITIVRVIWHAESPKIDLVLNWLAEKERQLLGIYWCKALSHRRFIFTSNPSGNVKLWQFFPTDSLTRNESSEGILAAKFSSGFGCRIMCLNASFEDEVLICGDLRGNLIVFPFPKTLMNESTNDCDEQVVANTSFKGAHGISTVCSIHIARVTAHDIEIRSSGGDGCICFLEYNKKTRVLEFVGMKQIKELSLIQAVSSKSNSFKDVISIDYAVGFVSTDFVIWNLVSETKVVSFSCGGWRRPHSFYLGDDPEVNHCFTYVKDESIVVHRQWSSRSEKKTRLQNIHVQFHGREIHTLCFLKSHDKSSSSRKSSWISTGCEDGTVRLTRYTTGIESWPSSELLGEHVGGSAVRSICMVSTMHKFSAAEDSFDDAIQDFVLLVSVGAKRVVTTWILRDQSKDIEGEDQTDEQPVLSFKWLSSDMPRKCLTSEDDLRHLAVTAFLVKCVGSRLIVCFVVVATSDATLTLRALVLPSRLWFDVASLGPLAAPVLSLQHFVAPYSNDIDGAMRSAYLIVSGATNGCIAIWDLTKPVENFLRKLLNFGAENLANQSRRPCTGRGSQGGRRRKSSNGRTSEKNPDNGEIKDDFSILTTHINPHLLLENVHQSGVNCLHVSDVYDTKTPPRNSVFCLASGGDDQRLHFFTFSAASDSPLQLLSHKWVDSAHSSAIKGVWTNGRRVFSAGIDQRLRSWSFDHMGNLFEEAFLLTSVPEPEALDAGGCDSDGYRIAVAGRGLQVIEYADFSS